MFGITDHAKGAATLSTKPVRVRRTTRPQRLILMGTGPFAVPAFEALRDAGHEIALVVTRPAAVVKSRKGPPPSPVRDLAARYGYAVFDPPNINTPDSIAKLSAQRASLLVVCDYGQILSSDALATTPLGGINLHGSLLPAYRGAAPVQWAVLNGNQDVYRQSLDQAARLIEDHFSEENGQSRGLRDRIEQLAKQEVSVTLPDLTPALKAMQAYVQSRESADQGAPASAGDGERGEPAGEAEQPAETAPSTEEGLRT